MKKFNGYLFLALTGLLMVSCGGNKDSKEPSEQPSEQTETGYLDLADYKAYIHNDLVSVLASIGTIDDATITANIKSAYDAGIAAIDGAADKAGVEKAFKDAKLAIANCIPLASGLFDYTGLDTDGRTDVLGVLEAYAVRNGITGISLFEDGGYSMYSDRVTLGTETYIIGYGFGTLTDGSITADMDAEENVNWKRYYHTADTKDPGTANYLNDQGSQVGDYYGYDHGGYFTNFLNDTKDGYIWAPELADSMPEMVGAETGATSSLKWRFQVKTGSALKYSTNSTLTDRAAFNNREVALEDYVTPFKLLLDANNNLYRGAEMAKASSGAIKGAKEYYDATKAGETVSFDDTVGIKVYEEGGKNYFEYEFTSPQNQFNAMYYITSSLYQPIPQSFIDTVSLENYLGFSMDSTTSPVDNSLSLGAYTLERWDSDQQIVYKKNPNYVYASSKFSIPGVHINILPAMETDSEALIKEFLAGKVDACGIPQTRLDEFKNDPRTRQSVGSSNFKLNVNATSPETWEYLFGEDGVVCQTPKTEYWEVKPCLSNSHFIKGLSLAINRDQFGAARGSVGSVNYLSPNYMSSSETILVPKSESGKDYDFFEVVEVSYNNTEAHQNAVKDLLTGTVNGFNLELSREYFKLALDELEADGSYTPGTKENPTVINLEIGWQYAKHEEQYHNEIKQYLETAFNDESVTGGLYKLNVTFWVGTEWSDVYYSKMMLGQFDLGFGSISGNPLNPLDFVSVLSSNQELSGGFTLNWGTDTNDPEADILVYNGMRWSYDALWEAANTGVIADNGRSCPAYLLNVESSELDGDNWSTVVTAASNASFVTIDANELVIFSRAFDFEGATTLGWDYAADGAYVSDEYLEISVGDVPTAEVVTDVKDGVKYFTVTMDPQYAALFEDVAGFDVYGTVVIDGKTSVDDNYINSVYCSFSDGE